MIICIDPGHGGKDPGAASNEVKEKDINLAISLKLASKLIGAGHKAVLSRCNDEFVELYNRAEYANSIGADIFVSIHNNAAGNSLDSVLTFSEAQEKWGLGDSTLREAVRNNRFEPGEIRKSGGTWLVTYEAMKRLYGNPKGGDI